MDRITHDRIPDENRKLYWEWSAHISATRRRKASDPEVTVSKIRETDFRVIASHAALRRHSHYATFGGLPFSWADPIVGSFGSK